MTNNVHLQPQRLVNGQWENFGSTVDLGPFIAEQNTISKNFSWEKYDEEGNLQQYRIIETKIFIDGENVDGYDVSSGGFIDALGYEYEIDYNVDVSEQKHHSNIIITHKLVGEHTLTIEKYWPEPLEDIQTLDFKILQNGRDYSYEGKSAVTMNKSESGSLWGSLEVKLPAYDEDGRAYVYDVREVTIPTGYYERYDYPDKTDHLNTTVDRKSDVKGKSVG